MLLRILAVAWKVMMVPIYGLCMVVAVMLWIIGDALASPGDGN